MPRSLLPAGLDVPRAHCAEPRGSAIVFKGGMVEARLAALDRHVRQRDLHALHCSLLFLRSAASSDDGHRRILQAADSVTRLVGVAVLPHAVAGSAMEVLHQLCAGPRAVALLTHPLLLSFLVDRAHAGTPDQQLLALNAILGLLDARCGRACTDAADGGSGPRTRAALKGPHAAALLQDPPIRVPAPAQTSTLAKIAHCRNTLRVALSTT